jgi:hypothetical protein
MMLRTENKGLALISHGVKYKIAMLTHDATNMQIPPNWFIANHVS